MNHLLGFRRAHTPAYKIYTEVCSICAMQHITGICGWSLLGRIRQVHQRLAFQGQEPQSAEGAHALLRPISVCLHLHYCSVLEHIYDITTYMTSYDIVIIMCTVCAYI